MKIHPRQRKTHRRLSACTFGFSQDFSSVGPDDSLHGGEADTGARDVRIEALRYLHSFSGAPGSVNRNVVPFPTPSDSAHTFPPWTSMIRRTMVRPIPVLHHHQAGLFPNSGARTKLPGEFSGGIPVCIPGFTVTLRTVQRIISDNVRCILLI